RCERRGHDFLHAVLAELGGEAIAHDVGPQLIDGVVQCYLVGCPPQGAGLDARDKDGNRIDADYSLLVERRGHGAPPRRPRAAPSCETEGGAITVWLFVYPKRKLACRAPRRQRGVRVSSHGASAFFWRPAWSVRPRKSVRTGVEHRWPKTG